MANLYKRYLDLLSKWPIDKSRSPDLGQFIRDQVRIAFKQGETTKIADKKKCLKDLESLERIASNYYAKKYTTNFKKTAVGLSIEECKAVLDKDAQEYISQQKLGFFGKVKLSIKRAFSKESKEQN